MESNEMQGNTNMIPCPICGKLIAKNAKKCPHCGAKMKQPIYRRKWFIIVCIIVVLGIIGGIAGGGGDETADVNDNSAEVEATVEETTEAPDPTEGLTVAQKNAYEAGLDYLEYMGFSKQGLIDQLSSEYGDGYEKADAEVAVETIEKNGLVDWVEEAKESAQSYLDSMSFSKDGLIEQLESPYGDNYTHEQAVEAVEAVYK